MSKRRKVNKKKAVDDSDITYLPIKKESLEEEDEIVEEKPIRRKRIAKPKRQIEDTEEIPKVRKPRKPVEVTPKKRINAKPVKIDKTMKDQLSRLTKNNEDLI